MRTKQEILDEDVENHIIYLEELIFDCKKRNSSEDIYFKLIFEQTLKELKEKRDAFKRM